MMATRFTALSARAAAIAVLLMRQNPIAHAAAAWCPGGRTSAKQFSPSSARSAAAIADPAAYVATSYEWGLMYVFSSIYPEKSEFWVKLPPIYT
jgi:hypothetical protein